MCLQAWLFCCSHNAYDKYFISEADFRGTCAVHCSPINQGTGWPRSSYFGLDDIKNEMSSNKHLAEEVSNWDQEGEIKEAGLDDLLNGQNP